MQKTEIYVEKYFETPLKIFTLVRYEGDWVEGMRQGRGKYTCKASGGQYEGEYRGDKKEGTGRCV